MEGDEDEWNDLEVVVLMERKDSRLATAELTELSLEARSIKYDAESGDDENGSTALLCQRSGLGSAI